MASPHLPMYPLPQHQLPMGEIECPSDHDVKSGRGVSTNSHPGNERFRSLVNCNKELYVTSTKREKMAISRSIVESVRSLDPPGRFLEKDQDTGLWSDIGDKKAIEKTSQALRDGAAALRRQLSADLGDPDFLNAVFDTEASPPEESSEAGKRVKAKGKPGKGKPPAKGHRRVNSNPTVGTATKTKALAKKARAGEVPRSPKQRSDSLNLPMIPRPVQSLSPGSDRASPGYERRSESHQAPDHHRSHSPSSPRSQYGAYSLPPRSASFDYHEMERGGHYEHAHHPGAPQSPMAYGQHYGVPPSSPRGHHHPPPHPMSPRSHHMSPQTTSPMSPLQSQPGIHRVSPSGYYQRPPSPTVSWSPRHFNHASPRMGPSLSPHPYSHPSDMSPYQTPEYRPTLHPRAQYPPSHGHASPMSLSVPTLGGERGPHAHSPPSPMWHAKSSYYPRRSRFVHGHVPRHPAQHYPSQLRYPEFTPPPPPPPRRERGYSQGQHRIMSPATYPERTESYERRTESEARRMESSHEQYSEEQDQHMSESYSEDCAPLETGGSPSPTMSKPFQSLDSPSAVVDVARAETPVDLDKAMLSPIRQKSSRDSDDYPFDEVNPAEDDISVSPLPFDQEEPTTLLDFPGNLLQLPISPCGPQDNDDSQ